MLHGFSLFAVRTARDRQMLRQFLHSRGVPLFQYRSLGWTQRLLLCSCLFSLPFVIPDCAVETSWGRMWGWNRREKRDRGNDIVGMSCRLIRYGPFQLRRNWKSL
jgi:hypothetical protein